MMAIVASQTLGGNAINNSPGGEQTNFGGGDFGGGGAGGNW